VAEKEAASCRYCPVPARQPAQQSPVGSRQADLQRTPNARSLARSQQKQRARRQRSGSAMVVWYWAKAGGTAAYSVRRR